MTADREREYTVIIGGWPPERRRGPAAGGVGPRDPRRALIWVIHDLIRENIPPVLLTYMDGTGYPVDVRLNAFPLGDWAPDRDKLTTGYVLTDGEDTVTWGVAMGGPELVELSLVPSGRVPDDWRETGWAFYRFELPNREQLPLPGTRWHRELQKKHAADTPLFPGESVFLEKTEEDR